jgi:hypothetical protein
VFRFCNHSMDVDETLYIVSTSRILSSLQLFAEQTLAVLQFRITFESINTLDS